MFVVIVVIGALYYLVTGRTKDFAQWSRPTTSRCQPGMPPKACELNGAT